MSWLIIIAVALHVLSSVFWAGTTFVMARSASTAASGLIRPQLGAAIVSFATGATLWTVMHLGGMGAAERVLAIGIAAALVALAIQLAAALRVRKSNIHPGGNPNLNVLRFQLPAGLLMITIVSMAVSRYV